MRILAVESSAVAASVALVQDGRIISECYSNAGLTHSRTLMPMVDAVIKAADTDIASVDCFAVSHGPGSFTGVRIGVCAVKGMADALKKPCIGISALESLAWNISGFDCTAVCAMDARCSQVYTAAFRCNNSVERIFDDSALSIEELTQKIAELDKPVYLVGDGAELVMSRILCDGVRLAPAHIRYQRAGSVGLCAEQKLKNEAPVEASALIPVYLRMPQAQRELKKRKG